MMGVLRTAGICAVITVAIMAIWASIATPHDILPNIAAFIGKSQIFFIIYAVIFGFLVVIRKIVRKILKKEEGGDPTA
jgi:hypothetical protein